jgi:hypothetical protein
MTEIDRGFFENLLVHLATPRQSYGQTLSRQPRQRPSADRHQRIASNS